MREKIRFRKYPDKRRYGKMLIGDGKMIHQHFIFLFSQKFVFLKPGHFQRRRDMRSLLLYPRERLHFQTQMFPTGGENLFLYAAK